MPEFDFLKEIDKVLDPPQPTLVRTDAKQGETLEEYRKRKEEESKQIAHKLDLLPRYKEGVLNKNGVKPLQKLSARHLLMVNYFIAGLNQTEVAEVMGMTKAGVNIIYNSPFFQQALQTRLKEIEEDIDAEITSTVVDAKRRVEEEALAAAERLVQLSQSKDEKIALAANKDLLDRCFGQVRAKDESPPLSLNGAQIEQLQVIFAESRKVG